MNGFDWTAWAHAECDAVRAAGRWRSPRPFDAVGPEGRLIEASSTDPTARTTGQQVVSFASNDYLGLTHHPEVVAAAHEALERWGTGSGSARLIVGSRPAHHELEADLAAWKRTDRAVLFPTGFAANLGVLTTFGGAGVRILSDELNHASIIDGTRLARAEVTVFGHGDLDHLAALLGESRSAPRPTIVVSDTVFSMDGDVADVEGLAALAADAGALLVLDEAHAVLGPDPDLDGVEALRVGTLSKTLGSLGGFVAGPAPLCDLLVNRARSYIFTTASSPADTAAAIAAVRLVRGDEGVARRDHLRHLVDRLLPGHPSPIVPVIVGEETATVDASSALLDRGFLVPAIRPPTVAPGTCRLRIALSADHTVDQVDGLRDALHDLGLAPTSTPPTGGRRSPLPGPRSVGPPTPTDRPAAVVVVVGTGTEVGKTWVSGAVVARLRSSGLRVAARKPAQSFEPGDVEAGVTDAQVLAAASGEAADDVSPRHRWYPVPMAPPMAAEVLGAPEIRLADLIDELSWPSGLEVGLVETAGGVRSPLAVDGDAVALIEALRPDLVLLVADARLGAINAVRSCLDALAAGGGNVPVLVFLNRFDAREEVQSRNARWLTEEDGLAVESGVEALADHLAALARAKVDA